MVFAFISMPLPDYVSRFEYSPGTYSIGGIPSLLIAIMALVYQISREFKLWIALFIMGTVVLHILSLMYHAFAHISDVFGAMNIALAITFSLYILWVEAG